MVIKRKFFISLIIITLLVFFVIYRFIIGLSNNNKLCFYKHLSEAVAINEERGNYYVRQTNGLSEEVSQKLIKNEKSMFLVAFLIDLRAQYFIGKHIPIVCDDFVDMNKILPKEAKPRYNKIVSELLLDKYQEKIEETRSKMQKYNKSNNFSQVAKLAYTSIVELNKLETKSESSFCMTRHILESIGLGAWHASKYSLDSNGEIDSLARYFLKQQIVGFSREITELDRKAQAVHNQGVGIICNDVPKIPFEEEYLKENNDFLFK